MKPPTLLGEIAQKEWDRLAPGLAQKKVLTDWDLQIFVNYCMAVQQRDEAEKELAALRNEHTVKSLLTLTPNKMKIMHPLLAIRNSAMRDIASFGSQLGLDPVSRSRISVAKNDDEDDWDEFSPPKR